MVQEKFSKGLKLAARLMLVLFLTSIIVTVLVATCSVTSSDNDMLIQTEPVVIETEPISTEPPKINEPVLFPNVVYTTLYDVEDCKEYIDYVLDHICLVEEAMSSEEYTDSAYMQMFHEAQRLYSIVAMSEGTLRHYEYWEQQHYYAAKTWLFFKQQGFSDTVTCAIIGNMMVETSGGTLDLKPNIYSSGKGFYGLCQWSLYYKPFMADKSFEEQLTYLVEDMPKEFANFGFCYKSGFTYEDFLTMEDPEQAALAFAKVYERCSSSSYKWRKQCALKVQQFFVYGDYDE